MRLGVINEPGEVSEAFLDLGCWRYRISALPPGPELVTALTHRPDALAPAPVNDPDDALWAARAAGAADVADRVVTGWANAVLESITARARVLSWLQAEQYTDLAMLSKNYPGLAEMLPTEVGFALRTSDAIAGNAISTARAISMRLSGTLQALRAGTIDSGHAMAILSATSTTTAEVAAQVEADLLPVITAPGSTITAEQLRRRAVRRVIARDPDGAADRHRTAKTDRTMTRWIEDDGMAGLKVFAPAQQIAAIWEAATAMADAAKTPGTTAPWVPAGSTRSAMSATTSSTTSTPASPTSAPDAVADVAAPPAPPDSAPAPGPELAAAPISAHTVAAQSIPAEPGPAQPSDPEPAPGRRSDLPARHGQRPHIQVLVPYTVLLGVDDPCELAGHGAITADQARAIIADGTLQRLLYDPTSGIVLDYGRTRYEPPETLKQFIIARDRTCRTPGCLRPAERCQIDHVEPFRPGQPTGGCTCHRCLDAKCLHHHRAKDGGGFRNTRDPDGTTHWTTPLGRNYTLPPPQVTDPLDDDPEDRFPPALRAYKPDGEEFDSHQSDQGGATTDTRGATTDASGATTDARGVPDGTVDPEPPPF